MTLSHGVEKAIKTIVRCVHRVVEGVTIGVREGPLSTLGGVLKEGEEFYM